MGRRIDGNISYAIELLARNASNNSFMETLT